MKQIAHLDRVWNRDEMAYSHTNAYFTVNSEGYKLEWWLDAHLSHKSQCCSSVEYHQVVLKCLDQRVGWSICISCQLVIKREYFNQQLPRSMRMPCQTY